MDRDTALLIFAGLIAGAIWLNAKPFARLARASGLEDAARDVERASGCGVIMIIGFVVLFLILVSK